MYLIIKIKFQEIFLLCDEKDKFEYSWKSFLLNFKKTWCPYDISKFINYNFNVFFHCINLSDILKKRWFFFPKKQITNKLVYPIFSVFTIFLLLNNNHSQWINFRNQWRSRNCLKEWKNAQKGNYCEKYLILVIFAFLKYRNCIPSHVVIINFVKRLSASK